MNNNFLDYYLKNLHYIKSSASDFAKNFPKIASRLDISQFDCEDPFVERLLEGSAFLAARIDEGINSNFTNILESVLNSLSSKSLCPIPSCAILELDIKQDELDTCLEITRDEFFDFKLDFSSVLCRYRPMWQSFLYPFKIDKLQYVDKDLQTYAVAEDVKSLLILSLSTSLNLNENFDFIDFYINQTESNASLILSYLISNLDCVYLRQDDKIYSSKDAKVSLLALDEELRYLDSYAKELYSLLAFEEYFSYPNLFKFFRLKNLKELFKNLNSGGFELIFAFKKSSFDIKNIISADSIKINYIALINLFKKRTNKSFFEPKFSYHIVPDTLNTNDYEVYDVESVNFYDDNTSLLFSAKPFYYTDNELALEQNYDYFSTHRKSKDLNSSNRSSYVGEDVFVSIAGEKYNEKIDKIYQFDADITCTNRDLPLFLKEGHSAIFTNKYIKEAILHSFPSKPKTSLLSSKDEWQRLNHIMINLSNILWQDSSNLLHIIRKIIKSYSTLALEEIERILNSILSIEVNTKNFRFIDDNNIFYEQGFSLDVLFSEQKMKDVGYFVFANVLWNFFRFFSPLNSHIEMNLYTEEQGFVKRWTTLDS